jgi:putative membrane protein
MNQPSAFQMQYPLSKNKFWKKIIPDLLGYALLPLVIIGSWFFMYWAAQDQILASQLFEKGMILVPVLMVVYFLALIIRGLYIRAYIKSYYYDFGEQFITIKKGVFAPTEIHVQYQKIQDVYVDQDVLDRMLGIFDVHIASATVTSGIEAHVDGVNVGVAENLKNIILSKIHNSTSSITTTPVTQINSQPVSEAAPNIQSNITSSTYPMGRNWAIPMFCVSFARIIILYLFFLPILLQNNILSFFIHLSVGLGLSLLVLLYMYFWKKSYYFEFMPDYILLRSGVISRSENHIPYRSIQNVINKQGIFDRLAGVSNVVIQNAAQQYVAGNNRATMPINTTLVWQPYDKASELINILNGIITKVNGQGQSTTGL